MRALAILFLATACTPISDLVTTSPEPAGENCAQGGTAIREGTDDNEDGELQDSEVDSVHYACDAAPATSELVSVTPEPEGANCSAGGSMVRTGTDADRDGVLDENEVRTTAYVCNGDTAVDQLVETRPEPQGSNCLTGGTAIVVGTDADADGMLSLAEVTSISYVCDGVFDGTTLVGHFAITNTLDATLLSNVEEITGRLRVAPLPADVEALSLPSLKRVGELFIESGTLGISLPALESVTGAAQFGWTTGATTTSALQIPKLESVGGDLVVRGGWAVFMAPALKSVGGTFGFFSARNLQTISAPELSTVGGVLALDYLPRLTHVTLPVLTSLGGADLTQCAALLESEFDLPPVEALPARLVFNSVPWSSLGPFASVTQTSELVLYGLEFSSISLPELTSVGRFLIFDTNVQSFSAAALQTVTGPVEINAPQLPACDITDILDAIGYQGTRNITAGPC